MLLFFFSLWIAYKWRGKLVNCGAIGSAIYFPVAALVIASSNYAHYGLAALLALAGTLIEIWLPVGLIAFFCRKSRRSARDGYKIPNKVPEFDLNQ
jgi:hypothetical protein